MASNSHCLEGRRYPQGSPLCAVNAPTEYDIAAVVPGHVASGANSSIVMQEHLPTMAELQQRQVKVDDSVAYARCVTFATQRPS